MFSNGSDLQNNSVAYMYANVDLATVELFNGYPSGLLKFAMAACIIYMLIGIPGNLITIVALARYEKVRNATAFFIINLSFADLLFCSFNLPLAASRFWHHTWVHGHILCKIFPFARYTFVAVALFTVFAITLNRYIMMAHPKYYPRLYTNRNITVMIACIWIAAIGLLIPTWFAKYGQFGIDPTVGSCSIIPDRNGGSPKRTLFLGAFLLPCIAIVICYSRIFCIVRKTTKKSLPTNKKAHKDDELSSTDFSTSAAARLTAIETCNSVINREEINASSNSESSLSRTITFKNEIRDPRNRSESRLEPLQLRRSALRKSMALLKLSLPTRKDRRLGTMIIAIIISFCLCHLPITLVKVIRGTNISPTMSIVAYLLLYLSSSINPLIYVVMSNEYRKAYRNLFRCRRTSKTPTSKTNLRNP